MQRRLARRLLLNAPNSKRFHFGNFKRFSTVQTNATIGSSIQSEQELRNIFTQLHDAKQLQFTSDESMKIMKQLSGAFESAETENEQELAIDRWMRAWKGRSFFEQQQHLDQEQAENAAIGLYWSIVESNAINAKLQKSLDGYALKNLAALGNLLYQLSEDYHTFAISLWEYGALNQERNCLYSLAQVVQKKPDSQKCLLTAALYRLAAKLEHPYAFYNLGLMYFTGQYGAKEMKQSDGKSRSAPDYDTALKLLQKAAELDVQPALTNLGNMYRLGLGTDVDLKKGIELYQQAADLGDPKAKFTLGNLYATGAKDSRFSVNPNPCKAFDFWLEAANLAQRPTGIDGQVFDAQTASLSFYNLGNCYFLGLGLPNCDSANSQYQSAPQFAVAVEFWELATQLDPTNLRAWLQLGNAYMDGLGEIHKNIERALYFYEQAAKQKHLSGDTSTIDSDTANMAESLAIICRKQLCVGHEPQNEVIANGECIQEMLRDARAGAKLEDYQMKDAFVRSPDLIDFEKERVTDLQARMNLRLSGEEALRRKWKYVENFISTAPPPHQAADTKPRQKCSIM